MEALLSVLTPSNILVSLQSFCDTIQNHIRTLSSLGKLPEFLMVAIDICKVSSLLRPGHAWLINITISNPHVSPVPTIISFYLTSNRGASQTCNKSKMMLYVYFIREHIKLIHVTLSFAPRNAFLLSVVLAHTLIV